MPPANKTTSRSDGGGRKSSQFVEASSESKRQRVLMSSDESDDEIVTPKNVGLTFTKGGVNSNPGGYNNERQMPSGKKEHIDDNGDGGRETESESEYDRKYAATSEPSTTHSRALLTDVIAVLLTQLKALDMVCWTQQNWKTFSSDIRSLISLVEDVIGHVPEFLLGANMIAMKWIYIQDAIVPLRTRLESSYPVMSPKIAKELRYVPER
jgi:hypothetical protein